MSTSCSRSYRYVALVRSYRYVALVSGAAWVAATLAALAPSPRAHADAVAYLVNVTVRPGYDFPNADAALSYGYRICDRVAGGALYEDGIAAVQRDFATSDDYQAAYLINQAVNELCPAMIWQLRQSAAHYTPGRSAGE